MPGIASTQNVLTEFCLAKSVFRSILVENAVKPRKYWSELIGIYTGTEAIEIVDQIKAQ